MKEGIDQRWIIFAVFAVIAGGIVAAILISRGSGNDSSSTTASSVEGCKEVESPPAKHVSFKAPKQVLTKGEEATAVVKTSCGTFDIALATKEAPKTANSFAFLAEEGFYDELSFPRIATGFVIQGGSPSNTTIGGSGYTIEEKPPENLAYTRGVVAMAKGPEPPGSSGSQFFVVTAVDAGLPPEYALVGRVSKGMDVVQRIGKLGTPEEKPKQPVVIEKMTIENG